MQRHENDNFLTALNVRPGQRVLDCTVGLAADALLASCAVGEAGKVVGLEASLPLWFLTSRGVQAYRGTIPELARDLHRVEIIHGEASAYLRSLSEDSFDAVYFDPMFRQPVRRSSEMTPLRPLAYGEPLRPETVELALKAAPRVVIKERSLDILKEYGCTEFVGTKYSAVRFGIRTR
jgi:16S rRNA G966 N2-methylase RsmD